MPSLGITGGEQLRQVGVDLRAAPPRMRSRLRRNIVTATAPIAQDAKSGFGEGYGALGEALAAATTTRVRTVGQSAGVSVLINSARLPADKQGLPPLVEGFGKWRHPLFGNKGHWYPQDPRPELGPAVKRHLPGVQAGVVAAVEETAQALARGSA